MLKKRTKNTDAIQVVGFKCCPAKTFQTLQGVELGRSVESHCEIVGSVARELINRSRVSNLFPEGAAFLAASHDIGKVSPTFYNKIMTACIPRGAPLIEGYPPALESQWNGHAGVSQLTAKHLAAPAYVPEIIGQHHGFSPAVSGLRALDANFGGPLWQRERECLVESLQLKFGESWPVVKSATQARLLAGLTSVADWIGSGDYFEDPSEDWECRIDAALDNAGFVSAAVKEQLTFRQVFGFEPRASQKLFYEQVDEPGVYVLEAPMGLGKTEAALYAAYKGLATGKATGIYFALPTQLTSNKIYERFESFLEAVVDESCGHRSLLLHSNAWLLETEMGEEGRPGGAWFSKAKRGLLAPFAVGTIDQALMAAMNVKHGFVRAFGLAGKVVILDEVHTYDAYTSTLMDSLIQLLRDLECTVIILSATLNQKRRQQLIGAPTTSLSYPLITAYSKSQGTAPREIPLPKTESQEIQIKLLSDPAKVIDETLLRAEQGEQVIWIENTVKEAQQRYLDLAARAAEINVDCALLHSRYTVTDRQNIEQEWVNAFGKAGWAKRGNLGRILIGTQVLEQSLDIDADFMVSRFAPSDMLLQRFGRLWRHQDTPRPCCAQPEAWLLAPDLDHGIETPIKGFGLSAYVYSPYVLCRSLEVWLSQSKIVLPQDIRTIIEQTYSVRQEKGSMIQWLSELEYGTSKKRGLRGLRQLARVTLAEDGVTLPESKAETRYSDHESFEVLLLKSLQGDREGVWSTLTLLDGSEIKLPIKNRSLLTKKQLREATASLMRQIVNVSHADKPKALPVNTLKRFGLQHCFFLGHPDWPEDESLLNVVLVDDSGSVRGVEGAEVHDKRRIEYRDDLGYRTTEK